MSTLEVLQNISSKYEVDSEKWYIYFFAAIDDGCSEQEAIELATEAMESFPVDNVFCPNGPGGGIDPSCPRGMTGIERAGYRKISQKGVKGLGSGHKEKLSKIKDTTRKRRAGGLTGKSSAGKRGIIKGKRVGSGKGVGGGGGSSKTATKKTTTKKTKTTKTKQLGKKKAATKKAATKKATTKKPTEKKKAAPKKATEKKPAGAKKNPEMRSSDYEKTSGKDHITNRVRNDKYIQEKTRRIQEHGEKVEQLKAVAVERMKAAQTAGNSYLAARSKYEESGAKRPFHQTAAGRRALQERNKIWEAESDATDAYNSERKKLNASVHKELRVPVEEQAVMGVGFSSKRVTITDKDGQTIGKTKKDHDLEFKKKVSDSADFLQGMMHRDAGKSHSMEAHQLEDEYNRAFHIDGKGVFLSRGRNQGIYVHEMGHGLEDSIPRAKQHVNDFRDRRTAHTPDINMKEKFGGNFRADEVGNEDDWGKLFDKGSSSAAYIGKKYSDGSTEVFSMGLQLLHDDPVHFARTDPEYFGLVVGILHGRF